MWHFVINVVILTCDRVPGSAHAAALPRRRQPLYRRRCSHHLPRRRWSRAALYAMS